MATFGRARRAPGSGNAFLRPFAALPRLSAGRLTLRPLGEDDLDRLVEVVARPGVREWWAPISEPERMREDLRSDGCAFAIEVDGALAGWLGFAEEEEPDYHQASVDIFLAPEYQGGGAGRDALLLHAAGARPLHAAGEPARPVPGRVTDISLRKSRREGEAPAEPDFPPGFVIPGDAGRKRLGGSIALPTNRIPTAHSKFTLLTIQEYTGALLVRGGNG